MWDSSTFDCLYYPFSRLLDSASLKYLLLIYDSVTFVDEAESTEWRHQLLDEMRRESSTFDPILELADDYERLYEDEVVRVLNPLEIQCGGDDETALGTLADLADGDFVQAASRPSKYGLPARSSTVYRSDMPDSPTWQIFPGKLPQRLLDGSVPDTDGLWSRHQIRPGSLHESWTLSYPAGSAATVNYYLQAASELGATLITTSALHHELVLRKLKRAFREHSGIDVLGSTERLRYNAVSGGVETVTLLSSLFPPEIIRRISISDILRFRSETASERAMFRAEIDKALRVIAEDPSDPAYGREVALVLNDVRRRFTDIQADLQDLRDRLIPSVAEGALYGAAGGGALSTFATFLGGLSTTGLVAASSLTLAGALAQRAGKIWADRRSVLRRHHPAVGYLLMVDELR